MTERDQVSRTEPPVDLVIPEPPTTGEPPVDEAIELLRTLATRPIAEHVEVYTEAHRRLHDVLTDLDSGQGEDAAGVLHRGS